MRTLRFVDVRQGDKSARPLIAELAREYATRYGHFAWRWRRWLSKYPADEFLPPNGAMLIGLAGGRPVTGGAFRRFGIVEGTETAELKRIWTDQRHRRQGYGRLLLAELENRIAARGYGRVYLTTGERQPEAEALYIAAGYTRLPGPFPADLEGHPLAFEKLLSPVDFEG